MNGDVIEQVQDAGKQAEHNKHGSPEADTAKDAETNAGRSSNPLSTVCGVVVFAMITSTSICFITTLYDDHPIIDPIDVKAGFIALVLAATTSMCVTIVYAALKQSMYNGFAKHFWTTFLSTILTSGSIIYMLITTVAFSKCLFYFKDTNCVWVHLRVTLFILSIFFLIVQFIFMHFTAIPKWKYEWLNNVYFLLILTSNYCIWVYFVLGEFHHYFYHGNVPSLVPCAINIPFNMTQEELSCLEDGIHYDWQSIKEHAAIFLYGCILENCLLSTSSLWHKFNGQCEKGVKIFQTIKKTLSTNETVRSGYLMASIAIFKESNKEPQQADVSIALSSRSKEQSINQFDKSTDSSNECVRFSKINEQSPTIETRFDEPTDESIWQNTPDINRMQVECSQIENNSYKSSDEGLFDANNRNENEEVKSNLKADVNRINSQANTTANLKIPTRQSMYASKSMESIESTGSAKSYMRRRFNIILNFVLSCCGCRLSTMLIAVILALNVGFVISVGLYIMGNHDNINETRLSFQIFEFLCHLFFLFVPSLLATFLLCRKPNINNIATENRPNLKIHINAFVLILTATGSCIFYWLNLSAVVHVYLVCSQNNSAKFETFECSDESYIALSILSIVVKLLGLIFQFFSVLKLGSYPQNSTRFALLRHFIIVQAIGNFGFWTFETFVMNFEKIRPIQNSVFGESVWFVVVHVLCPCVTFFRLYCFEILIDFTCKDVPIKLWSAVVNKCKGTNQPD